MDHDGGGPYSTNAHRLTERYGKRMRGNKLDLPDLVDLAIPLEEMVRSEMKGDEGTPEWRAWVAWMKEKYRVV